MEMTEQSTRKRIKIGVNGWKLDGRPISLVGGRMIGGIPSGKTGLISSLLVLHSKGALKCVSGSLANRRT